MNAPFKSKSLTSEDKEIKNIVKLVTSVFVRNCKQYGLYYCMMTSPLKQEIVPNTIGGVFASTNKSALKEIFGYNNSPSEIELITHLLNNLIHAFLDGKYFTDQSKLGMFGLNCFNLICKTRFGSDFEEEKNETVPQSWFDLFCFDLYVRNKCFNNESYENFVKANLNLLKNSYKNSEYYKLEQKGLPPIQDCMRPFISSRDEIYEESEDYDDDEYENEPNWGDEW